MVSAGRWYPYVALFRQVHKKLVRRAAKVLKKKDPEQLFLAMSTAGRLVRRNSLRKKKLSRKTKKRISYTTAPREKPSRNSLLKQTSLLSAKL